MRAASTSRSPFDDPYPSRLGGPPRMLPREDPVVHGDPGAGPLDRDQLRAFERDGYLFLESWLPRRRIEGCMEDLQASREALREDPEVHVVHEPESEAIRSFFAIHRTATELGRLLAEPRLAGVARQILGSDVYIHQSRVNLKPGFDGREFYWHSDFETWHVEDGMPRMRALSASIFLTENRAVNGPLMVIPGSHARYVSCGGRTPASHHETSLRKQEYGVPDRDSLTELVAQGGIVAPVGPVGSVVFFDCNLMHGSSGNLTPYPRSNAFCVYNSVENTLRAPYSGQEPRPEHIAGRSFDPIGRE